MQVYAISIVANAGGNSQAVSVSASSAQSAAYSTRTVLVSPTVNVWYRAGSNPTALSNGTDQFLFANNTYRIEGLNGNKLAFIASESGTVYITPEP